MAEAEEKKPNAPDRDATPWLKMIKEAQAAFDKWQKHVDRVDDRFADLEKLAQQRDDREFQMFWANMSVVLPSLYSRPPVPVASPRHRDRKQLPRIAADVLERALLADFEADDVHSSMLLIRDDLGIGGRGVPWLTIGDRDEVEVPMLHHVSRRDFLHDPSARYWHEVGWVAKCGWADKRKVKKRFGEIPEGMTFEERKEDDLPGKRKAAIWEIWDKDENTVVWVSEGVETVLDRKDPWMSLKGYFPCPRPAYGTLKRQTLIPVPDFFYVKDQLEEISEMTARISGLCDGLRMKGLYPAGNSDIGDAIQSAMRRVDNQAILVPIASMASMGSHAPADMIVWLPFREVAETIMVCIQIRQQLIQDVYEITGISDIMRGSTDAQETLGAQQLKSQYGSIRIRERQGELVRVARDITRMKAEIMAENIEIDDLLTMGQIDDLPRQADLDAQAQQMQQQAMMAMQQLDPNDPASQEQIGQIEQQLQQQMAPLQEQVTVEKVAELLKSQRVRPFVLDIETDSTIQPDENSEKEKRNEFMAALGPFMQQAVTAMQSAPQLAPFMAESLRFVASGFRPGRRMDDAIDELAESFASYQPPEQEQAPGEDPEAAQMTAQAAMTKAQADAEMAQAQAQKIPAELQIMQAEAQAKGEETAAKVELTRAQTQKVMVEIGKLQAETQMASEDHQVDAALKLRGEQRTEQEAERGAVAAESEAKRAERMDAAKIRAMQRKPTGG